MKGPYPPALKNRISGGHGHLSNLQALNLFLSHRPAHMSYLILSHLSRTNNDPGLVEALFNAHAGQTQIILAPRNKETNLFSIQDQTHVVIDSNFPIVHARQLELF
jgi:phosphoribosyl 1,2-cyclic phosphodiesterase